MQNPKIIPRKDEATAVEERLVLYYFLLFRVSLTLRDPDRGHFDPHGDVRRSSSWRVARFILAFDQRNYSLLGRSRTEEVSFRGRMPCCVSYSSRRIPPLSRIFPSFFARFSRGVAEKGEARTCFVSPRTTFPLTSDFSPLPSFLPSFPSLFLFLCNLQRSILTLETPLDALIFSLSFYLIRIVYLDRIPVYHDPRPVYLPSDRLVHLAATTTELTVGRDAPLRQLMFVLIVFLCWCSAPRVRESQTIRRHTSTGTYTRRVTHLGV